VPPTGHRPRMLNQTITLVPFITPTGTQTLIIPQDYQGALTGFGQGIVPTLGGLPPATMWTDILWSITVNDRAISPDFVNFTRQIGTFTDPFQLYIMLQPRDVVQVTVTNMSVVTSYDVSMLALGWDYPSVEKFDREKCFSKKMK